MPTDKDALSLLKGDHDDVKKLFKEIEAEGDQEAIFNQIKEALEVHATIEEEIFYPAVKKARSEEVKDEVREAYEEHKQVKALLAAIAEISPSETLEETQNTWFLDNCAGFWMSRSLLSSSGLTN